MSVVEVFADVTCPFTHVGLKRVVEHVAGLDHPVEVRVRAWPLEWVNGVPMAFDAVTRKAQVLADQLGVDDFAGLRPTGWPATTLPALELAARAYRVGAPTGLATSMAVRRALFEQGLNVAEHSVLARIADEHGVPRQGTGEDRVAVEADYAAGRRRGVRGSPHFWIGDDDFFCPMLDLGRDAAGELTARFDVAGLTDFFTRVDR